MSRRNQVFFNVVLAAGFMAVVILGLKTFSLWQQVLDMLYNDPLNALASMHPHALRYTVVFPFLALAQTFGLPPDVPFSIFVGFLIVMIGYLGSRLLSMVLIGSMAGGASLFPWVFLPIAVLSLAMNGRIALAMCGITLIVTLQTAHAARMPGNEWGRALGQLGGLLLASVSSGTIVIGFLMILGFNFVGAMGRWPVVERRDFPGMVLGVIFGLAVVPTIVVGFFKNVNYFGGGIFGASRMLEHGAGAFLPKVEQLAMILGIGLVAIAMMVVSFAIRLLKQRSVISPLVVGVVAAICGGAFGFSTLASAAPLFLVTIYALLIERQRERLRENSEALAI